MSLFLQFLFAFLGLLVFVLMGARKTFNKYGETYFKWSKYLIDDLFELAIAIVCIGIMIPASKELMVLIDTRLEILACAFIGYMNIALWKQIVAMFKSKKFIK